MNRIQLSRRAGYRKPENAIVVARPTKWGNPFKVGETIERTSPLWPFIADRVPGGVAGFSSLRANLVEDVVDMYFWWFLEQPDLMLALPELCGHDLACWCPLDRPCHADVLIEMCEGEEGACSSVSG